MNIKELINLGVDAAELFLKMEDLDKKVLIVKETDQKLHNAIMDALKIEDELKEILEPAIEKNGYPLEVDFGDNRSFIVTPNGIEDGCDQ